MKSIGRIRAFFLNQCILLNHLPPSDKRRYVILHIPVDPFADSIRSHPRYKALLRKMNLEA